MKKSLKSILLLTLIAVLFSATACAQIGGGIQETSLPDEDSEFFEIAEESVPLSGFIDLDDTTMQLIEEVLALANSERAKAGVAPLSGTPALNAAAAVRAQEVAKLFSHNRPDGTLCFTVLGEFNITSKARGENIAGNFRTPEKVVDAWMKSPGHRDAIMNPDYTSVGIGVYTDSAGKLSWVMEFIG